MSDQHQGTCGKCGKPCRYVHRGSSSSCWVHEDTGNFLSTEPEVHDCNTYIVRESDR